MSTELNNIDLTPNQRKAVAELLKRYIPDTEVWAYGSRVKFTSTPKSDLDLVAFATPEQKHSIFNLKEAFEESSLPFRVDLFIWDEVPEQFHKNIETERLVLQEKKKLVIGCDWPEYRLGEVTRWSSGGTPPKNDESYWSGDIPWISASSMYGNRYAESKLKITPYGLKAGSRLATKGSILLLVRGSMLHQKIPVGITERDVSFNQDVKAVKVIDSIVDPWFLLFWFMSNETDLLSMVENTGIGAGKLDTTLLQNMLIRIPPLKERQAIVVFAKALDDKIELNRRMNATLEGMAQALLKSWFVDFDPVIDNILVKNLAKCPSPSLSQGERENGSSPTGRSGDEGSLFDGIPEELTKRAEVRRQALANGTANREAAKQFPAAFLLTEKMGWIPGGWEISKLKDCTIKIGSGSTPRGGSSSYIDDGTRLVRSQNIHDSSFQWAGIVCITDEAAYKLKGVTLTKRDVLINITGDSILRTCVVDPSVLPARVNQHVAILRPKNHLPKHYLHQYVVRSEYKTYLLGFDAGGSRKAVTKGHLEEAEILLPHDDILSDFSNIVDPFFDRKNENELQTRTLTTLRDTLLPKLISGEIRIPDAEKLVEDVL